MTVLLWLLATILLGHQAHPRRRPTRAKRRRFAHWADYALNDSPTGLRTAVQRGYDWIDLNFHVTADGVIVCTHWAQPLKHGWYDPLGKTPRNAKTYQLTWAEVKQLRHRDGHHIRKASTILAIAARLGIGVEFEAKNSPAFLTAEPWEQLGRIVKKTGVRLVVKSLSNLGNGLGRLREAHQAGRRTMLLPRGTRRIPRRAWAYVDEVRGPVIWTR